VLLNILIALYNSAYEDIYENADDEYLALFAQKTMQFVRAPDENVFIAPFNLIEVFLLVIPLEWWMTKKVYVSCASHACWNPIPRGHQKFYVFRLRLRALDTNPHRNV
jgi:hypothetical protein